MLALDGLRSCSAAASKPGDFLTVVGAIAPPPPELRSEHGTTELLWELVFTCCQLRETLMCLFCRRAYKHPRTSTQLDLTRLEMKGPIPPYFPSGPSRESKYGLLVTPLGAEPRLYGTGNG